MKTIIFDTELAEKLEAAICDAFDCKTAEIVGLRDTLVKKVIVFIFCNQFSYDYRLLAKKYQICYLYVPTVVQEIKIKMLIDPDFLHKIKTIQNKMSYEKTMV